MKLFKDEKEACKIVKNVYWKLKTFLYSDKTLFYQRERIALFEDDDNFNNKLCDLARALFDEDFNYFEKQILETSFFLKPKKFKSDNKESDIFKIEENKEAKMSEINFFIDCSVELLIVDFLYMLLIKKISLDYIDYSSSFAGKFKNGIFLKNTDLISGVDFDSNRCFDYYFKSYKRWRDTAFKKVEEYSKNYSCGSVLFSLDLQSFYYSVCFSFESMHNQLMNDDRLNKVNFIENLVSALYKSYFLKIKKYRKHLKIDENNTPFPIGLYSPIVLRDIYMNSIDKKILDSKNLLYYGRYVDDILILFSKDESYSDNNFIDHFLIEQGILKQDGKKSFSFVDYPNLKTSFDAKDKYFVFKGGEESKLIKAFKDVLNKNSSEYNLLPDVDFIESDFDSRVYSIIFNDASHTLRNLNLLISDISSASHYMRSVTKIFKGTSFATMNEFSEKFINQLNNFFDDCLIIQHHQAWPTLFESYMVLGNENNKYFNELYRKIIRYINSLDENVVLNDDLYNKRFSHRLINILKENLKSLLNGAVAYACSLNPKYYINHNSKILKLISAFRNSNMFDQSLCTVPLIGCLKNVDKNISLLDPSFNSYLNKINSFEFDLDKVVYAPYFFTYFDLNHILLLKSIQTGTDFNFDNVTELFNEFNHIKSNPPISEETLDNIEYCTINKYTYKTIVGKDNLETFGLVNVSYDEKYIRNYLFNPYSAFDIRNKIKLIRILLDSKAQGISFVVFPELCMPIEWIKDISLFLTKNKMSMIFGALYLIDKKTAHNFVVTLISFGSKKFSYLHEIIREKIHYPPTELQILSSAKLTAINKKPRLDIISNKDFSFSNLLCFELTDINLRALLKDNIDLLIVPELNHDTNYFGSIIESTARDLYIYVLQENTTKYGDSRITGPFDTVNKNIIQFKGGENNFVVAQRIDFKQFKTDKDKAQLLLDSYAKECFLCKKIAKKMKYGDRNKICKDCSEYRKYRYKTDKKIFAHNIKPKPPGIK